MSWINPITDLDIMMQSGKVTYIDLESYGLPTTNQEDLKTAVETITQSITDKVAASDRFTPVEREFVRALMANVADNGLLDGNEYKQLPIRSSMEQSMHLLRSDVPPAILAELERVIDKRKANQ